MRKLLFLPILFVSLVLSAQSLSTDYINYIEKYKQAAVDQEIKHLIPAEITLAQGLLESAAGKSTLATEANNHFGIKCHKDWTGPSVRRDDDAKDECFRSYADAAQSFEDHALFLKKARYAQLFELDIRDFRGWARGLKECGYATDPGYAAKLIKIVEDYNLVAVCEAVRYSDASKKTLEQLPEPEPVKKETVKERRERRRSEKSAEPEIYETADGTVEVSDKNKAEEEKQINPAHMPSVDMYTGHKVYRQGFKQYVVANLGDSYKSIAAEFNIELKRILRLNRASLNQKPRPGDRVYIIGKRP